MIDGINVCLLALFGVMKIVTDMMFSFLCDIISNVNTMLAVAILSILRVSVSVDIYLRYDTVVRFGAL